MSKIQNLDDPIRAVTTAASTGSNSQLGAKLSDTVIAEEGAKADITYSSSVMSLSNRLQKTNLGVGNSQQSQQVATSAHTFMKQENTFCGNSGGGHLGPAAFLGGTGLGKATPLGKLGCQVDKRGLNGQMALTKNSTSDMQLAEADKILKEIQICVQISQTTAQRAKDVYYAYMKAKKAQNGLYINQPVMSIPSQNRALILVCAVFIASNFENESSKKQTSTVTDSEHQTAASQIQFRPLSLTDIIQKNLLNISEKQGSSGLKSRNEIDDFITIFKDVQKTLPVQSKAVKETLQKCLSLCQNFQTSLKIYNKFDAVWQALSTSKDLGLCQGGTSPVNSMSMRNEIGTKTKKNLWILYIICKQQIFDRSMRDVVEFFEREARMAQNSDESSLKTPKKDYLVMQNLNCRQICNLVEYAFLLIAVCQEFVKAILKKEDLIKNDQEIQEQRHIDEKLKSVNELIELKVISQNNSMGSNDNLRTIGNYAVKVRDILKWIVNQNNIQPMQGNSNSPSTRTKSFIPLTRDFLEKNEQIMSSFYQSIVVKNKDSIDERYFANVQEKMKTPLKMVQSPFHARLGPMQRHSTGLTENTSYINPPAAPSKRQLFPTYQQSTKYQNGVSQGPIQGQNYQNTAYSQFQRNSQEPPSKRQEIEAPGTNLTHQQVKGSDTAQRPFQGSNPTIGGKNIQMTLKNDEELVKEQKRADIENDNRIAVEKGMQDAQQQQHQVMTPNTIHQQNLQSRRELDFSSRQQEIQNPTLLTKLNEVQFPEQVGHTPVSTKCHKCIPQQQLIPNTPISEMMKLRNWYQSKIIRTKLTFDETVLPAQKFILSDKLLRILQIGDSDQEFQFNKATTKKCCMLIETIIMGLARKQIEMQSMMLKRQAHKTSIILDLEDQQNQQQIEIDVQNYFKQLKENHFDNIFGMTAQLLERIFQTHDDMGKVAEVRKLIHSELFIKSIIICTSELQYFIFDVHDLQCCEVAELIEQPPFDFWRILSIFLKIYPDMPRRINIHFREIELRIISFLAWKKGSSVLKILEFMKTQANIQSQNNEGQGGQQNSKLGNSEERKLSNEIDLGLTEKQKQKLVPYNCFFSRVLQAAAGIIVELSNMLNINAEYQEVIWGIVKSLLSSEPMLLMERHVDQLVMCTIYSVAKISELRHISFNSIINKYANLFENQEYVTQIYTHCVIDQDTGRTKDIITFYNEVYLKKMKQYIYLYRDQCIKIREQMALAAQQQAAMANQVQHKALTPGANGQTIPGFSKPKASAILTPVGTKLLIKAFCPSTPLYDQYGQYKNSILRNVTTKVHGLNNATAYQIQTEKNAKMTPSSKLSSSNMILDQSGTAGPCNDPKLQQKLLSQSFVTKNSLNHSVLPGKPPRPQFSHSTLQQAQSSFTEQFGPACKPNSSKLNDHPSIANHQMEVTNPENGKDIPQKSAGTPNQGNPMQTVDYTRNQAQTKGQESSKFSTIPMNMPNNPVSKSHSFKEIMPQNTTTIKTIQDQTPKKFGGNQMSAPGGPHHNTSGVSASNSMRMNLLNKIKKNSGQAQGIQQE